MKKLSGRYSVILMLAVSIPPLCLTPRAGGNMVLTMLGVLSSILPEAVILLIFVNIYKHKNIKNRIVIRTRSLAAVWFLGVQSVFTVCKFVLISENYSGHFIGRGVTAGLMILSSLYIASLSINASARTAMAVMMISAAVYIMMIISALKNADMTNLHIAADDPAGDIAGGFIAGGSLSEASSLYILALGKKADLNARDILKYLTVKAMIIIIIFTSVIIIVGENASSAMLPVFEIAAYSKGHIAERYDSIFMMILTLLCIMKTGTEFSAVKLSIRELTDETGDYN